MNWIKTLELAGLLTAALGLGALLKYLAEQRRIEQGRQLAARVLRAASRPLEDDYEYGAR